MRMLVVALGVSSLCFIAVELAPGDKAMAVAIARYGEEGATKHAVEYVRRSERLDRPMAARYLSWLAALGRGEWGRSLVTGESVAASISVAFRRTFFLAASALGLSLLMAFPLGLYCSIRPGGTVDTLSYLLSSVLASFPPFAVGVLLILLFSLYLGWFPVAGYSNPVHLVLPSATLALGLAASSSRVIQSSVHQAVHSPSYKFGRYKGLEGAALFLPYGLLHAAPPVVTYVGMQAAGLLDGVLVVENLFAWPGLGRLLFDALLSGDILVLQGAGLYLGWLYVTVNTATELLVTVCGSAEGSMAA